MIPVTVDELLDQDLLAIADGVAWERTRETVVNCKHVLTGAAIATPERLEAFLLYRERAGRVDVVAAGCRDKAQEEVYLGLLLRYLIGSSASPLCLPKLSEGEFPSSVLAGLGFTPRREHARYTTTATPA